MNMDNPAAVFADTPKVDYAAVAKTVAGIQPRALTPPQYEDVVVLIEWMQSECVRMHEFNEQRSKQLDERSAQITAREKELRVRARTIDTAAMTQGASHQCMRDLRRGRWP